MLVSRLDSIRKPVRYWNSTRTGLDWYYIPTSSLLGVELLPWSNALKVKDRYGNYVDDGLTRSLYQTYDLNEVKKVSGDKTYFNTPVNIGVTYLNEEVLGAMFINNIDLLMRQKYSDNLNTPGGGDGVLKGVTFSDKISGDLSVYNPINNGSFSVLRGEQLNPVGASRSFRGVKPLVEYKVIDMYDDRNDSVLRNLFGSYSGGYSTKAAYLKSLDSDTINPETGMPFESKPFVISKVTFYLDVIIPYFSVTARELRSSLGEGDNFIDVLPKEKSVGGSRRICYTRYFAVTP
ncbi:hypothetical protein D3C71_1328180 [compost metagenome]